MNTAAKPTPLAPVAALERVASVDVIRGGALLGILAMNICAFAMPYVGYINPYAYGGATGNDFATWIVTHLLFERKFMTVFSMLFGAGLILMHQRAEQREARFAGTYYRRLMWLVVIGALHAYLLWYGDILFNYAICGLLLYPLRRRSVTFLLILGIVCLLFGSGMRFGMGKFFAYAREQATMAETALAAGETPPVMQLELKNQWENVRDIYQPPPEKIADDIAGYRGNYLDNLRRRAKSAFASHTQGLPLMFFWRIFGIMLFGMALMKAGVFAALRSRRFYVSCTLLGYGIGLPTVFIGMIQLITHKFDFVHSFQIGGHFNYLGSLLVALGHISVVMLICKSGMFTGLKRRVSAVGQMALTNYLMHTILLTPIFYGFGLGLYGHLNRFVLMWFVLGLWILQLIVSPLWLKYFRFGPAEWLWRSLIYRQRQPMRING